MCDFKEDPKTDFTFEECIDLEEFGTLYAISTNKQFVASRLGTYRDNKGGDQAFQQDIDLQQEYTS
jgi:hypothetical protein